MGMNRVRDVQVIEVIRVVYIEGEGVPGDPVREIVAYYSPEGLRLAEYDEWAEKKADPIDRARRSINQAANRAVAASDEVRR